MVRQGDIIRVNFDPQLGNEQKGRRPALVVSNDALNEHSNIVIVCPITRTNKNRTFQVKLDGRTVTNGVILCDHIKSIDIKVRNCEFIEVIPNDILFEVCDTIGGFINTDN